MNTAVSMLLAVLFVPQANDETLSQAPLADGEAAFVMRGDAATLTIGGADVVDRSALRGYRVDELDRADYVVTVDGGFTYSGAADKWTLATTGGKVLTNHVTVATKRDIYETSADTWWTAGIGQGHPPVTKSVSGKSAVYTIVWPTNTVSATIENVAVSVLAFGDTDEAMDITAHHFPVIDTVGSSELGKWREWARDLYNGNRGADWSKYAAVQNVALAGNKIAFDAKAHYTEGVDAKTNLVVYAGGYPAIEVSHHGTTIEPEGQLSITSFAVTNLTCYVGFTQDISGFDISKLSVFETYSLAEPVTWTQVSSSYIASKTDGLVVVRPQSGYAQRFLKLVYDGSIETEVVTITLGGVVCVSGDLAINGTNLVAWMKDVDSPLRGRQFDFAQMKGMYEAVSNIVCALGGSVTNYPAFNQ